MRPRGLLAVATAAALAALSACTTLTPMQTASPVPVGTVRVSGHLSATPWCSLSLNPFNCPRIPDGIALPELRASARLGVAPRADAGLSFSMTSAPALGARLHLRGLLAGAQLDGKYELWSTPAADGRARHLVSAGGGVGFALEVSNPESGAGLAIPGIELFVPVHYGYQTPRWEWVVSPRWLWRLSWVDVTGDDVPESLGAHWMGLSVGAYSRGRTRFGASIEFAAPARQLNLGMFTLSVGVLFDLGGTPETPGPTG